MSSRLVLVRSRLSEMMWDGLDRSGTAIACHPESLNGIDEALLDRMVERRSMLIVCLDDRPARSALAAALIADLFAVRESAAIELDLSHPVGMAGLVWRIGRSVVPLLALNDGPIDTEHLISAGIADVLVPHGTDPLEWVRSWVGSRSLAAIQSAARLVRSRGGEDAERAEFALLFAAGVPHEGLSAFLERRPPRFEDELIVETI